MNRKVENVLVSFSLNGFNLKINDSFLSGLTRHKTAVAQLHAR